MPPLVVPQAVLVRIVWGAAAAPTGVNVIGARKTGAVTVNQALADTLFAAFKTAFGTSGLANVVPTTLGLLQVGVRDISSPSLPEFMGAGAPQMGTQAAGKILPPQTALCITLRTALAGKSFRGRVFIGSLGDTALAASGAATSAAATAARDFVVALRTAMLTSSLELAVVSRKLQSTEVVPASGIQSRSDTFETIRGRSHPGI